MDHSQHWQRQVDTFIGVIESIRARSTTRNLIALAGPPASGKSTLARHLADTLPHCSYMAMDGFHLPNNILIQKKLLHVKGAPETFDLDGFSHMINRLGEKREVYVPAFDRANDQTINCAYPIPDYHDIVIIEGNYLLLNEPKWSALDELWDFAIFIEISIEEVERRATERWITAGLSPEMITKRVEENDLHNAERVLRNRVPEDLVLRGDL